MHAFPGRWLHPESGFLRVALFAVGLFLAAGASARELVRVDDMGVIRWSADDSEVALFGANYCLPSASDYRAAGYIGADRRRLVEKDMLHFARMGWDAMRLCLCGDWENSDVQGNLISNDHLDLMDYAIAEAKKRGIHILLTPITTYAAWWPDAKASDPYAGFSAHMEKSRLGTDPAAIAAQVNYLQQMMRHVNPYTGVALKDEPQIIFVEMINEPWHHADDFSGSVAYINALVDAVRSTGCEKILFHNLSQDMRMVAAIKASRAQGVTFAWYPTGLNSGHLLTENHLRSVDDFPPMLRPDLLRVPKIVYEFDAPDMVSPTMYPAMARAFRGVGAQFATMFSYDMLDTAPYNLGWQTHFLNLVYSPRKAVSAIIAAEALRTVPRYAHFGEYPENCRFGPFRVSYDEDLSEMITAERFIHAGDTRTSPPDAAGLRQVVGVGSSPVVDYEGCGAYFLDRLESGIWRLEVYPDAVLVQDPFAQRQNYRSVSSRLVSRTWPMTVRLPDLGDSFHVVAIDEGNFRTGTARQGTVGVSPGVYLLSRDGPVDRASLPERVGRVGLAEFVCPAAPSLPPHVLPAAPPVVAAGAETAFAVDVVDTASPRSVTLHVRGAGEPAFRAWPMARQRGYRHAVIVPGVAGATSDLEYFFSVETSAATVRHPADPATHLTMHLARPGEALPLFQADVDAARLNYTRIGDTVRRGVFKNMPATETDPAALRLMFPLSMDATLDDYTTSLPVRDRVRARAAHAGAARALRIVARGSGDHRPVFVTLVEADGTAWSVRLSLADTWSETVVPLADLALAQGVKLPLGYPERWNYWTSPARGRGAAGDHVRLEAVERLQISIRPGEKKVDAPGDSFADVSSVSVVFE